MGPVPVREIVILESPVVNLLLLIIMVAISQCWLYHNGITVIIFSLHAVPDSNNWIVVRNAPSCVFLLDLALYP